VTGRQDMGSDSEPVTLAQGFLSLVDLRIGQRWPLRRSGERDWIDPYVRWAVFQRDGGRCLSCGVQLTLKTAELDHVVPWSADGTDRSGNLRLLCPDCNFDRSNFHGPMDTQGARRVPVCAWCVTCAHLDDDGNEVAEPLPVTREMVAAFCGTCGMVSRTWPDEVL
jgi:hypothetical protein